MDPRSTEAIAFLFTDIEGSTRLWEQFPEAMNDALRRHDTILRGAIERSGGQVVKTTGDGMMAVFGDVSDGVAAALGAQRGLTAEPWTETGPLRVRMGLHLGQADQRGGDYFGPTVNRTARIMSVGHGGQILLSGSAGAVAEERMPPGAGLLDLGEHRLKDLGRPERVYQLLHPDLASDFPPLSALLPVTASLPARAADLVGRQIELREIRARLDDPSVRLLTLIGPGGTGKTTLAIRVAEDCSAGYPDGATFVDLSTARDTEAVFVAIARSVGLGEVVDRPLQEELTDRLRDRKMLLILDNLEQITAAAGALAQLLVDCPRLTMLATSREALHVRAEHLYPIAPLGLPPAGRRHTTASEVGGYEAVQLFVQRARSVRPDFTLTDDNAPTVAEICQRLDGLPLAIELAAARLRLFSPEVLRDRLGDRLSLLRSGPRDVPERQQTLRATMDWSYELLAPAEQRLFGLLAVFAGGEIAAIEAVAADVGGDDGVGLDVLDGLAGLTEKSLLRYVDVAGSEPRVAMLETIREFAADRLDQHPDLGACARRAHATYFAELARRSRVGLTGNQRETALAAMATEVANLRIAWAYWVAAGDIEQLDKLADSLLILDGARGWYLDIVALTTDMLAVLAASESSPDRVGQEIALRTSLARALIATKGFTREVEDALVGAIELFEQGADGRQQYPVLRGLASLYMFRAQFDKVARLAQEILALGERDGDPAILLDGHFLMGTVMATSDDLSGGLGHFETAISLFATGPLQPRTTRVGNDPRVACHTTSALTLQLLGYPDRAAEHASAALELAARLEHPFSSAYARFHAGLVHLWRREPEIALELAFGLLEIADEHDFRIWNATGSCLMGAAQVELGRFEEGLARIRSGVDLYQELLSPPVFWPFLLFIDAGASHRAGRPAEGLPRLDAAIEIISPDPGTAMTSELHLLKGDMLAALAPDDRSARSSAEPWYRLAFDRAVVLDARMTQLRAATRLGRLWQAEGHPEAAAATLGPVYDRFTEGFAIADLREARDLLDAVAPGRSGPAR